MSLSAQSPILDHLKSLKYKLQPYYMLRPRLWSENVRPIDRRTAVSHRWTYAYLRVPKAANRTVAYALQAHFPEPGIASKSVSEIRKGYSNLGDLSLHDAWSMPQDYFVFTIVRNPYHRILSTYINKFEKTVSPIRARYEDTVARFDDGAISFRGFCRYLASGGERSNPHWMRQTRILGISDRVDYIGYVESLDYDLEQIVHRIKGNSDIPSPLERRGSRADASQQAERYYDDECRQIVEQVYASDFRDLGYRVGAL